MSKPAKKRTDADYVELDNVIGTLIRWEREIVDELARRGRPYQYFGEVMDALRQVHSPEDK